GQAPERGQGGLSGGTQDGQALGLLGRKPQDVAEIEIQRHEAAAFLPAACEERVVVRPAEFLIPDRGHVVPRVAKALSDPPAEVLVQLQPHAGRSVGMSTKRSRAISAPYAMAARMSSAVSCGYASRSSGALTPSARLSRMSDTQMRVPRMHGLPKHTLGSIEMRLKRSCPLTSKSPPLASGSAGAARGPDRGS